MKEGSSYDELKMLISRGKIDSVFEKMLPLIDKRNKKLFNGFVKSGLLVFLVKFFNQIYIKAEIQKTKSSPPVHEKV